MNGLSLCEQSRFAANTAVNEACGLHYEAWDYAFLKSLHEQGYQLAWMKPGTNLCDDDPICAPLPTEQSTCGWGSHGVIFPIDHEDPRILTRLVFSEAST